MTLALFLNRAWHGPMGSASFSSALPPVPQTVQTLGSSARMLMVLLERLLTEEVLQAITSGFPYTRLPIVSP